MLRRVAESRFRTPDLPLSLTGFRECGSVGIRAAGSERDVEPYAGTDFSNFVSGIPDRVAAFLFRYFASAKYK